MISYLLLTLFVASTHCKIVLADGTSNWSDESPETCVQAYERLEGRMKTYESELHRLSSKLEKMEQSNAVVKRSTRQVGAGLAAFSAGVSAFDLDNLGEHQTILFDNVITNVGNAYDPNSGMFTAPVDGVYVFTAVLMVNSNHAEYLELISGGVKITDVYADAHNINAHVSTSKTWVLELTAGTRVWLRTTAYENESQIHGNSHSMFSGFLLSETEH
ncbi:complement C1q tumor necrosis factor-related protein 3-like [Mya arenaria]|uniref:complement C1q tumor necrosis factor-related protein 3-like n=1 Tax=Mya arenaria TaxID=6604 RepID=UPI0022E62346|nr:complement C1q tumor necrosis factor-related protein 3-like [Mya arenaria]